MNQKFQELLDTQCEVLTQIQITSNYNLFGLLTGNRDKSNSHVNKLRQSLRKKHVMEVSIIVVCNPTPEDGRPPFLIIDGQHRFEALKKENLPITFVVVNHDFQDEPSVLDIVELLNTSSLQWDVTNFMGSKCELGDENYLRYRKIYDKFDFEHEIMFYTIKKFGGVINHDMFKKGILTFDNEMYHNVYKTFIWLEKYLPIVERYGKRYYLKALLDLYFLEDINLTRLNDVILSREFKPGEDWLLQSGSVRQSLIHIIWDFYNVKLRKNIIAMTPLDKSGNKNKLQIIKNPS